LARGAFDFRSGAIPHQPCVRRVNIDTDLRLASTSAMRRLMATNPGEFDPRKFFGATLTAMRDVCVARYEQFVMAGNASKIKPISLEGMYQRHLKGELNAKVNQDPKMY